MRISDWSSDVCSSDLQDQLEELLRGVEGDDPAAAVLRCLRLVERGNQQDRVQRLAIRMLRLLQELGEAGVDRKSTRLNSSPNAHLVCRLLLDEKNQLNHTRRSTQHKSTE